MRDEIIASEPWGSTINPPDYASHEDYRRTTPSHPTDGRRLYPTTPSPPLRQKKTALTVVRRCLLGYFFYTGFRHLLFIFLFEFIARVWDGSDRRQRSVASFIVISQLNDRINQSRGPRRRGGNDVQRNLIEFALIPFAVRRWRRPLSSEEPFQTRLETCDSFELRTSGLVRAYFVEIE